MARHDGQWERESEREVSMLRNSARSSYDTRSAGGGML